MARKVAETQATYVAKGEVSRVTGGKIDGSKARSEGRVRDSANATFQNGDENELMTYGSPILAGVHETVERLHAVGLFDKATMREFDEGCLTPVKEFPPEEIKALREREEVSQAVFARYLYVATSTVSQWERGERKPEGAARKLLELVRAHGLAYIR